MIALLTIGCCWFALNPWPPRVAADRDCEEAYAGLDDWPTERAPVLVGPAWPPIRDGWAEDACPDP